MIETQHDNATVFAGYLLESAYEGSPDWVVSGYDRDGYETKIFTVNSEGAARSTLYKITGDPAWLAQSGKTERRPLREFNVLQQLQREMDRARESIVTARESQDEDPTDLEWPGIEEGSIDWLRSLMEVARAGGLDVSAYEAAITGTPEDSEDDESDDADPADVDATALAHPGENLIAAGSRFYVFENPMCGFRIVRLSDGAEAAFHGDDSCERFCDYFHGDEDTDHPADNADAADDVGDWAEAEFTTAAEREAIAARLREKYPALVP